MKSINGKVILSCIEDHKTKYTLPGGTVIQIQTHHNGRRLESNSQLGVVEALPVNNKVTNKGREFDVELSIGDVVYVHHFSFFGGSVGDNLQLKRSDKVFYHDSRDLFSIPYIDCFFTLNNGQVKMLNDYILLEPIKDSVESDFLYVPEGENSESRARVVNVSKYVSEVAPEITVGAVVFLIDKWARYQVWIDGKEYYRARMSEVVAFDSGTID